MRSAILAALLLLPVLAGAQPLPYSLHKTDDGKLDATSIQENFEYLANLVKQQKAVTSNLNVVGYVTGVSAASPLCSSGGATPNVTFCGSIAESQVTNLVSDLNTLTTGVAGKVSKAGDTMTGRLTTPDVVMRGPVLDVRYFGATGNGSTDDTAAIQAAVNAAAVSTGSVVRFPGGVYVLSSSITIASGMTLFGDGATLKQTAPSMHVFFASATMQNHGSSVTIEGFTITNSSDVNVSKKYAIRFNWFDNVVVRRNRFLNYKGVWVGEVDDQAYGSISSTTLNQNILIAQNDVVETLHESQEPIFQVRYSNNVRMIGNSITGSTHDSGGAGFQVFGGNADPKSDGALGVPINPAMIKCSNIAIAGNVLKNQASGINVAQCRDVSVTGNSGEYADEALWVGASLNTTFSGNAMMNGVTDAVWQTQGIIQNVTFDGNVFVTSSTSRGVYVGADFSSANSPGPLRFTNNVVYSLKGNAGEVSAIGHLEIKGNTFYNINVIVLGPTQTLEIEDNKFLYDTFSADPVYGAYMLRLDYYNSVMAGVPGSTQTYTSVKRNLWFDRTGVATTPSQTILLDSPGTTGYVYIEGNEFKTQSGVYNITLANTSSTTVTLDVERNKFSGKVDFVNAPHFAGPKHVFFRQNFNLDGSNYLSTNTFNSGIHFFSTGSVILSNDPNADLGYGWMCTTEGTPGTWKPITSLLGPANVGIGTSDPSGSFEVSRSSAGGLGPEIRCSNPAAAGEEQCRISFFGNSSLRAYLEMRLDGSTGHGTVSIYDGVSGAPTRSFYINSQQGTEIGLPGQASTIAANGGLYINAGSSITESGPGGYFTNVSSISGAAFFGDGSHLTGIVSSGSVVLVGAAAGGDLTGTYPNPTVVKLTNAVTSFSSITVTGGGGVSATTFTATSSMTAAAFFGDGSHLTGIPSSGSFVSKAGDTMTGQLTISGSTLTVQGNAFSVGASTFSVSNGTTTVGGQLNFGFEIVTNSCGAGVTTCTATCSANKVAFGGDCDAGGVGLTQDSGTATTWTCGALTLTTLTAKVRCARVGL